VIAAFSCSNQFSGVMLTENIWWLFKFLWRLKYSCSSAISTLADHVISTGCNIKWDYFDILTTGKSAGADPGFFLGGVAPLRNDVTDR